MLNKLISDNYGIQINDLKLFTEHFGTEIFIIQTTIGKFVVKTLPVNDYNARMENEGYITEFLRENNINVPKILKSLNNMYCVSNDKIQFHVQEFIEGENYQLNTASELFLEESACIIGKIHSVFKNFKELHVLHEFSKNFFNNSGIDKVKQNFNERLEESYIQKNYSLIPLLKDRIKHLEKISTFNIDGNRLTYSNGHGDYRLGNMIINNGKITVIDWTNSCKLPICFDVIKSYVYSSPECKNGLISSDGLKRYIENYSRYNNLSEYDIQIMPYLYYYHQLQCNYSPPYDDIPETYMPVCKLIINVTNWLYDNVENLSNKLR